MLLHKVCPMCDTHFKVKPSKAKRKYCSQECGFAARMARTNKKFIGKTFGKLTVLKRSDSNPRKFTCECECGNVVDVDPKHFGETVSCGCYRIECGKVMGEINFAETHKRKNVAQPGDRFGRWVVTGDAPKDGDTQPRYMCVCDCGTVKAVRSNGLFSGSSKSCGCYKLDVNREQAKRLFTKHGSCYEPWYRTHMKHRRRECDSDWTKDMERSLKELQPVCVVCGSDDRLAVDHVVSIVKGGRLVPGNAVILCKGCNSSKYDKWLDELPEEMSEQIEKASFEFALHYASETAQDRDDFDYLLYEWAQKSGEDFIALDKILAEV